MAERMTIAALQQLKRDGKKSIGVVAWSTQLARIADRAGVDFISMGALTKHVRAVDYSMRFV